MDITTDELKREYRDSFLSLAGVTFQKAITEPLLRMGLEASAKAHRKNQTKQPQQLRLV